MEIFCFLWSGIWERLKRAEMKKAPRNGGKGVPNFFLFIGAYYTALNIKYATNTNTTSKTVAMSRFLDGLLSKSPKTLTYRAYITSGF